VNVLPIVDDRHADAGNHALGAPLPMTSAGLAPPRSSLPASRESGSRGPARARAAAGAGRDRAGMREGIVTVRRVRCRSTRAVP
jgi:hypothetical protein